MNYIVKNSVAEIPFNEGTPTKQVSEILQLLRPLLRLSEEKSREATGDTSVGDVTPAMLRLLGVLHAEGPQTVPALARSRGTGRQYIQRMVNDLLALGLIERTVNPAHRTSWILSLTEEGAAHMEHAARHHHEALGDLAEGLTSDELQTCLTVLTHLTRSLGNGEPEQPVKHPARKTTCQKPQKKVQQVAGQIQLQPKEQAKEQPKEQPEPEQSERAEAAPALNWNGGGGLQIA